jgi:hypothetical protein
MRCAIEPQNQKQKEKRTKKKEQRTNKKTFFGLVPY